MDHDKRQVMLDAIRAAGRDDMADEWAMVEVLFKHRERLRPPMLREVYIEGGCIDCGEYERHAHALVWHEAHRPCWVFEMQCELDPGFLVAELHRAHTEALAENRRRNERIANARGYQPDWRSLSDVFKAVRGELFQIAPDNGGSNGEGT